MRPQLALALVAFLLVPPAHAVYQSTKSGATTAFMAGNSSVVGENVTITSSGGLLVHNRQTDPGFNSAFDFDSTVPGDQTLAASATSLLVIGSGAGPDSILIGGSFGSFAAPADQTFAAIEVSNVTTTGKRIAVDNSLSLQNTTFLITTTLISAPGINVTRAPLGPPYDNVSVVGGSGNDTFNVQSLAPSAIIEPLSLFPGGGTNSVTIGTLGNLDAVDQNIHITGFGNNTALTIDDSTYAVGRLATITSSHFTSPTLSGIFSWDANALSSLTVNFGPGADTVNVSSTPANVTNTVNGGDGDDAIKVTVATLGANSVNIMNGGNGNDTFNVTPGAASGAQITINGDAPTTPPGDTLNYLGPGGFIVGNQIRSLGTTFVTFNSIETLNGAAAIVSFAAPFNPTVDESTGMQQINLTLSGPMPSPVTVQVNRTGGTATPVLDFFAPAFDFGSGFPRTVTFPAGATSASFSITIVNDNLNEPPETIDLALANPSANAIIGTPSTTTVTIASDDFAPSDVPTLSQIGLALFGLLLVGVAIRRL